MGARLGKQSSAARSTLIFEERPALPDVVLLRILRNLGPREVMAIACVSRRWHELSKLIHFYDSDTRALRICDFPNEVIPFALRGYPNREQMTCRNVDFCIEDLAKNLYVFGAKLKVLRMYDVAFVYHDPHTLSASYDVPAFWRTVFDGMPNLSELIWHNVSIQYCWLPSLQKISFCHVVMPPETNRLKRLQLSGPEMLITPKKFSELLTNVETVEALILTDALPIFRSRTNNFFDRGLLKLRHLRELCIANVNCDDMSKFPFVLPLFNAPRRTLFALIAELTMRQLGALEVLCVAGLEIDLRSLGKIITARSDLRALIVQGRFLVGSGPSNASDGSLSLPARTCLRWRCLLRVFIGGSFAAKIREDPLDQLNYSLRKFSHTDDVSTGFLEVAELPENAALFEDVWTVKTMVAALCQ